MPVQDAARTWDQSLDLLEKVFHLCGAVLGNKPLRSKTQSWSKSYMYVQSVFFLNVSDQWRKQFDLLLFVVCFYFLY